MDKCIAIAKVLKPNLLSKAEVLAKAVKPLVNWEKVMPQPHARAVEMTEAMTTWLGCLARWDVHVWETLSRVREGGGRATASEIQSLVSSARLVSAESVSVLSTGAVWDLLLLRDAHFVAATRACLGEAAWWAHLLAGEIPPTAPNTPTPTQAARHIEAMIAVLSNVITIECNVNVLADFYEQTRIPTFFIQLLAEILKKESFLSQSWSPNPLLRIVFTVNAYFVSEIAHTQEPPMAAQATYVGVGLKLLQLVPSLLCLTQDTDFIRGEQTIICIRYFLECLRKWPNAVISQFLSAAISDCTTSIDVLLQFPSIGRTSKVACPSLALSTYPALLQRAREHADGIREKVIIILALLTDPFKHEESQATSQVFPALPQQMAAYMGSRLCDRHMKEYLQTLVCAIRETNVCTYAASILYECMQNAPSMAVLLASDDSGYIDCLIGILEFLDLCQGEEIIFPLHTFTITEPCGIFIISIAIYMTKVCFSFEELYPSMESAFSKMALAAMGLLLGEVMRYQPLIPVVEARDLARVLQLVLSSPLVQSREARERLLAAARPLSSATSASCSSIATTTPAAAADAEGEVAAAILFGLPQTPWPCDRGWLDGVFHLVHCCSVHPHLWTSLLRHLLEGQVWSRMWPTIGQVLDMSARRQGNSSGSSRPALLDWRLLSPIGLHHALVLALQIAQQEPRLLLHSIRDETTDVLACLNFLISLPKNYPSNENCSFVSVSQAAVNILELPLKAKNTAEYLPVILPAFATGGTLGALGDLAIYMTTASIAGGEHSRRVPAVLVECGRESGRCFLELASSGLALGSLTTPLDHPFVVSLGGPPSDRFWRADARLAEQSQQIESLIDSIILTVKTPDGNINPAFVDLVIGGVRTSDNTIFIPMCKFLTYLLFKAIESHVSPASSLASRSTPTVSRSRVQTLLQQLVFALVSVEDGDKTNPILKQLLSPGRSLPTLLWSLSALVASKLVEFC
ncbi:hypothetical protein ACTXT7_012524 [Hymenolepis weldensis]